MKPIFRRGCFAFVILLSGASFWLEPAAAEILFKADFETGDFSQFSGKSKNIKPGHIEVVTDVVHSGKYAGRFTIHEDNVFNARQLRVQANGPKVTVKEESDTFVSFYMSMKDAPKDRDNFFYWEGSPPPRYNNVMTWWVEPKKDGAGTAIKFGTGNLGRKGVHWEGDFAVGRWHQLGMHIHWSEDPARGNVKLWWDGVVVLDKKVQTKGPQSVYFSQPGIHRDPHSKSVDTIYFDDILCATTLEEIEIQKPDTTVSTGPPPPRFKAVAFDYFVIFNPNSVVPAVEEAYPGKGADFTRAWRAKQFEYGFLRSITNRHADFFKVTEDALVYTAEAMKLALPPEKRKHLLDAYLTLKPWPDAVETLRKLKASGVRVITIANFSRKMLRANADNAGIADLFDELLSTEVNGTYKPDPRAYALGMERLGLKKEEIVFAAFGGWDAYGAKTFGYTTYWVNRFNLPVEELGIEADGTSNNLEGLLKLVLGQPRSD
jgi:2-haloacid dehalogenase